MDALPPPPIVADAPPQSRNLMDAIRLWREIRDAYPILPDAQITLQPISSPMANGGALPDGRTNLMLQEGLDRQQWDDDARRVAWLRQMLYHEAGHSLQQALGPSAVSEYWSARGLPGTPEEQAAKAWESVKDKPNPYQLIHEQLPDEMFAEDFAGLADPAYRGGAETTFGIPYSREALSAFFTRKAALPVPQMTPTYEIPGLAPGTNPFASLGPR